MNACFRLETLRLNSLSLPADRSADPAISCSSTSTRRKWVATALKRAQLRIQSAPFRCSARFARAAKRRHRTSATRTPTDSWTAAEAKTGPRRKEEAGNPYSAAWPTASSSITIATSLNAPLFTNYFTIQPHQGSTVPFSLFKRVLFLFILTCIKHYTCCSMLTLPSRQELDNTCYETRASLIQKEMFEIFRVATFWLF